METDNPSAVLSRKQSNLPLYGDPLESLDLNVRRSSVWSRRSNSPKATNEKSITWRKGPSFSSWNGTVSEKHFPRDSKLAEDTRVDDHGLSESPKIGPLPPIAEVEKFSQWIEELFNSSKNGKDLFSFHQQIKEFGYIVRDDNNQTLLHALSSGGQLSYVKFVLLTFKSKIEIDTPDNNKWTPLCCALYKGHLEIADLLIKHGADVLHMTNTQANALHLLSVSSSKSKKLFKHIFLELINRGCLLTHVDSAGDTPFHTACYHGNLYMLKLLHKKSSEGIGVKNYMGLNCMDIAIRSPHLHVASFLMTKVDSFLLLSLPDEIWLKIMSFVDAADVCRAGRTCKRFHQLMYDGKIWEAQFKDKFGSIVHLKHGEDTWHMIYRKFHTSSLFPQIEIPMPDTSIDLPNFNFDIVLIGDLNVGKSSLILRYTQKSFNEEKPPYTEGFREGPEIQLCGYKLNIRLWDIPRKRPLGIGIYRSRHAIMLVYDVGSRDSFSRLKTWHQEIAHYSKNSIVLIVGNKCDVEDRMVSVMEALDFVSMYDCDYFEVSAKNNTNLEALFRRVAERVLSSYLTNSQDLREKKCLVM